ncbi:MAG: autotransporter outer membrane beta-barrel domain-containing protein, partial [Stenotrophomonas sp.]|uniref:autotransporter outer membrane beta-barrel domain-containing protein n=1 Tax=Stenotrophomonas sp. TaxID=69392 RepID=UPI003D6CA32F
INDGAAVTSTTGSLGAGTGATGNATISGTGSSWKTTSGTFNVGGTGTGHLLIEDGGLLQNTGAPADPSAFGYSVIGSTDSSGATSTATVTGAGSTWSTDGIMTVGYMAAGDLQVLDGGTVTTKGVEMARNARGSGNVTVAGANSLLSSDGGFFRVGSFGTADLTITDGGRVEVRGGKSTIGNNATAVGTATVSNGGSWATLDDALYVGMLGTGTLTVSDGGIVESKGGILGDSTGTGTVTVTGDGSQWTNGGYTLEIGAGGSSGNGTGSVTIADGGLVQNKMGRLGRYAGATGTLTISDANSVWQNDGQLVVGDAGTGTLSIASGATVTSVGAAIANEAGAAGTVTVDGEGSQLNIDGALVVGNAGTATLTITDQAAVRAGAVSLASSADAVATLNIGTGALAGTLEADSITGGAGTATINLDHTDTIELAGMSGNLTVNKTNTGTVRLLGASDYAGTTTVDGGMLQAGIANAFSSNADYALASTAVLDMGGFDQGMASLANAGVVAFAGTSAAAPVAGATLTVAGDYVGNGGTLLMNSVLGGDDSVTDKLVVGGSTSGETFVQVQNVGGAGAVTDNGIQLVSVAGASDGVFELQGRAVGGLYDYALQKGGRNTPDDGGWYLRSEALPTPPVVDVPTPVAPEVPVIDPPAPTPVLRPEPAAYLGNQTAALRMFQGTMHDRVGEPGLTARNDAGQGYAAWVRVQSGNLDAGTVGGQIDIDSNANVMQMGVEKQFAVGEGRVHAGLMGGYGRATTNGSSEFTDYRARGEVSGKNIGLYGTWFQNADGPEGLYVDGAAQYGTFDNTVKGDYLSRERYDSKVWSASVEAGYAFNVHSGERYGVYVEPQAQVIYSNFSSDDVVESNGTVVQTRNAGGTTTRLGARVYGRPTSAQFNRVQPFVAVNWWSGGNDSTIAMDGERLSRDLSNNTYEAKVGAQLELGHGWSGWGQMGYQEGSNGYRDVNGQIGVKLSW